MASSLGTGQWGTHILRWSTQYMALDQAASDLPPPGLRPCIGESNRTNRFESNQNNFWRIGMLVWSYCCTSPHPGLLRLHFFHHRPRRAKSWVSPRLTGAMVPPKFHLCFLLHARPSFRQLPWGRGLGSVRSFSGTKTSLTIRLELLCPGEGFFWPSLSLN